MQRYGGLATITVPAPRSGFHSRPAKVYLPPAWFSTPRPELPVVVLLGGIPGSPSMWFSRGGVSDVADDFQVQHHGVFPIIISMDASGGQWTNPVCTDSPQARVRTFLTEDLPAWLKTRFNAEPDQHRWIIGGLS